MPTVQGATVGRSRVTYGSAWSLNRDLAFRFRARAYPHDDVPSTAVVIRTTGGSFEHSSLQPGSRRMPISAQFSKRAMGGGEQKRAPRESSGLFSNEALILSIFVLPASLGYWDVSPPFHFLL
ncbi:hypothetical protein FA13DRAFT_1710849 [Coprinellus micaceus]|uniref:Uncharacterized protein n=1 Tax=Coprinellus micaceus TaxID=71717 RepID=A0A4Y7T7N4_COPMI|nr:hypothetical protein FA13DRAFT_1710849 [Coprinellus micaceus]